MKEKRLTPINFITSAGNESDLLGPFDERHVPVLFELNGYKIRAELGKVPGAAGYIWHLMVGNFYWGQLGFYPQNNEWRFSCNTKDLGHLSDYFGETIMLWEFLMLLLENKRSRFNQK